MIPQKHVKQTLRILQYLKDGARARTSPFDDGKKVRTMIAKSGHQPILVPGIAVDILHKASLLNRNNDMVELTGEGKSRLKRLAAAEQGKGSGCHAAQHRQLVNKEVTIGGAKQIVNVNISESPLLKLAGRKMKSGEPWIDAAALEAGERLRMDFTRGQLMQKVTSSWDPTSGTSNGRSGAGGKADISDNAIDARSRLDRALVSVGPDLAGVLTDICCFLKGFEKVERERQWPPRSAKLMLRVGLNLLANHYGTKAGQGSNQSGRIVATP